MAANVEFILGIRVDVHYAGGEPHFGNARERFTRGNAVNIGSLMKLYRDRGKETFRVNSLFK
jgi:hypothetical protein